MVTQNIGIGDKSEMWTWCLLLQIKLYVTTLSCVFSQCLHVSLSWWAVLSYAHKLLGTGIIRGQDTEEIVCFKVTERMQGADQR